MRTKRTPKKTPRGRVKKSSLGKRPPPARVRLHKKTSASSVRTPYPGAAGPARPQAPRRTAADVASAAPRGRVEHAEYAWATHAAAAAPSSARTTSGGGAARARRAGRRAGRGGGAAVAGTRAAAMLPRAAGAADRRDRLDLRRREAAADGRHRRGAARIIFARGHV